MSALIAQSNIQKQNREMDDAMARLSSGLRINSSADDAAGTAIASKMEAQVRSLDMAIRNSYDAISMTQTAEGALGEMENVLQRIRELSVQAGNSTLSAADRSSIQKEVDALISELDSIASKTNFNGVKLLDGSRESVTFQTGIDATDALNVNLEKSDTTALGLKGGTFVNSFTSGRVSRTDYSSSTLATGAIKLNGENLLAGTTAYNTNLSTADADAATALAAEINKNTSVHGAVATAFNELTSLQKATFTQSTTFTINSDTVAIANSAADLVRIINRDVSEVTAVLNTNGTITLSNDDGADIIFSAAQGAVDVGLVASTGASDIYFTGFIKLENKDGSRVQIEAANIENGYSSDVGTIADVQALGFNEVNDDKSISTGTVSDNAITTAHDIKINDVGIGVSTTASAASKAIAINAKTAEHGVTANASNRIEMTLDFDNVPTAATKVYDFSSAASGVQVFSDGTNSYNAAFSTDASTTVAALVTAINAGSNNYVASASGTNSDQLTITAGSGGNNQPDFDSGLSFTARINNVAQVQRVTLNDTDSDLKYSAIEVTDGATTATVIQKTADGGSDFDQLKDAIAALTDFSSDVKITANVTTATDGVMLFTSAEAGKAITGTYKFNQLNASPVTLSTDATDYQVHTTVGSTTQKDVFTIKLDSGAIDRTNALEHGSVIGTNGGVVELTFTGPEGSGVIYQQTASEAGSATNTDTLVAGLAAQINARADFAFTANVDANGDLQLVAGSNGAGKLTANTVALAVYSWHTDDLEVVTAVTANTTGTTKSATNTTSSTTSTLTVNGNAISVAATHEMTDVVSSINNANIGDVRATVESTTGNLVLTSVSGADITIKDTQAQSIVSSLTDVTSTAKTLTTTNLSAGVISRGQIHLSNEDGSLIKLSGDNISELGAKAQSSTTGVESANLEVTSIEKAQAALATLDSAIAKVTAFRSSFGAVENRIDASINNLSTLKINTEAAKSRIEDADFAAETSKMTKSQILSQAATSMLAQANASKQNLLALLQG